MRLLFFFVTLLATQHLANALSINKPLPPDCIVQPCLGREVLTVCPFGLFHYGFKRCGRLLRGRQEICCPFDVIDRGVNRNL